MTEFEFFASAGVAGISFYVLYRLYRDLIAKEIFPKLSRVQAYRIIQLLIIIIFLVFLAGLGAWLYSEDRSTGRNPGEITLFSHPAYFEGSDELNIFLCLYNSQDANIQVTHLWFDWGDRISNINNEARRLPTTVEMGEEWCSWVPTRFLKPVEPRDALTMFRARLASGEVLESIFNPNRPSIGPVPGDAA